MKSMRGFLANSAVLFLALGGMTGVAHAQYQPQDQGQAPYQPQDQGQGPYQAQNQAPDQASNQAPDQAQQQAAAQPGVARVSLMDGNVSVLRADSGTWVAATLNTPLMNGDTIATGPDSRAEVQLDYANVLRLDSSSTAKIANLDRNTIQVQVSQGLVSYDVLGEDSAQAEIDTPNVAVHPLGNGSYRVEVDSNQQTLVTLRRGEADVSTPQGSTRVESGQSITIEGTDNPQYQVSNAGPEDSWDRWNTTRDRRIDNASSWHNTDRYYTGSQDLDAYGHWIYVPGYGQVWQPDQGAGWAPYRTGRWVWEPYYGWTWVSYEPWGWAPYHYGRWFLHDDAWDWWPGPVAYYPSYDPVWAPAYVSFFGFGSGGWNVSVGIGFGNVGWLPCGPADPFFPWYGAGRSYIAFNFNDFDRFGNDYYRRDHDFAPLFRGRGGYSNFRGVFTDGRIRGGASWMSGRDFGRGAVPRQEGRVDLADFRQGRLFSGRVPVLPNRESLRATNRAPNPNTIRRFGGNERFFTHGHPAPAVRSFNEQRAQLQRTIQDSRGRFGAKGGAAFTSVGRGRTSFGNGQPGAGNGSRPQAFGQSGRPAPNFTQGRNGWHGFTQPNRNTGGNGARMNQGKPTSTFGRNRSGVARAPAAQGGNWRTFNPSSRPSQPVRRGSSPAPASQRGWNTFSPQRGQPHNAPPARGSGAAPVQRGGNWRAFTPSSRPPSQAGGWHGNSGRQPLNLRQPIVQRRSYGNPAPRYNAPHNYGNRAPRYNAPRSYNRGPAFGGRNVYRGGGAGRAPAYQAPRRSFGGGGGYRGGGGNSRGSAGGGRSAPRGAPQRSAPHNSGGRGHGR